MHIEVVQKPAVVLLRFVAHDLHMMEKAGNPRIPEFALLVKEIPLGGHNEPVMTRDQGKHAGHTGQQRIMGADLLFAQFYDPGNPGGGNLPPETSMAVSISDNIKALLP